MSTHPKLRTRPAGNEHLTPRETDNLIKLIEFLHDETGVAYLELARVCHIDKGAFSRKKNREEKYHFTRAERAAIRVFAEDRVSSLKRVVRRGLRAVSGTAKSVRIGRDAAVLRCTGTSNPSMQEVPTSVRRKIIRSFENCLRQMTLVQTPTVNLQKGYPAALLEAGHVDLHTDPPGERLTIPTVCVFLVDPAQLTDPDPLKRAAAGKRLRSHEIQPVVLKLREIAEALEAHETRLRKLAEADECAAAARSAATGSGYNPNWGASRHSS